MSAQEKNFASRTLTLLRDGPFRRYIIGSAISDTPKAIITKIPMRGM